MAVALLVAAGSGERLGAARPKAFVTVAGRPMLEWSVDALRAAGIERIVVALPDGEAPPPGCAGVRGGAKRSESVRAALRASAGEDPVVVHDAARPLVTPELFRRAALASALAGDAGLLARATDDAWLIERAGGRVRLVASTAANFKVTTPHDLRVAELLLSDACCPTTTSI